MEYELIGDELVSSDLLRQAERSMPPIADDPRWVELPVFMRMTRERLQETRGYADPTWRKQHTISYGCPYARPFGRDMLFYPCHGVPVGEGRGCRLHDAETREAAKQKRAESAKKLVRCAMSGEPSGVLAPGLLGGWTKADCPVCGRKAVWVNVSGVFSKHNIPKVK